jgi:PilZ domain
MRFPINAQVLYHWVDDTGVRREAEGRTRDVSERSAFVSSRLHPPEGTSVQITFFLPAIPLESPTATLSMDAKVVRTERGNDQEPNGFAVEGWPSQVSE